MEREELRQGLIKIIEFLETEAKSYNQSLQRYMELIQSYKKVYILIGITVTIIGLILIPFLHLLVNDYNKLESLGINAIFIYILYNQYIFNISLVVL